MLFILSLGGWNGAYSLCGLIVAGYAIIACVAGFIIIACVAAFKK